MATAAVKPSRASLTTIVDAISNFFAKAKSIPDEFVLKLEIRNRVVERAAHESLLQALHPAKRLKMRHIVKALERAANDPRCKGVVGIFDGVPGGFAQLQELREALRRFADSKKFTVAYADSYSQGAFFLGSAFDRVVLNPAGQVELVGVASQQPFLRGLLDRLEVKPRIRRSTPKKTGLNMLLERDFTPEHRETTERLVQSLFRQLVDGVAVSRKLPAEAVSALVDNGPYPAAAAKEANLVNELLYEDEVTEQAVKDTRLKEDSLVSVPAYFLVTERKAARRSWLLQLPTTPKVALIYAVGNVSRDNKQQMSAREMAAAFKDALKDPLVQAIVLRIDSPGGDALASEVIWRQVQTAKKAGKPVVASIGNVGASGAYYVASAADAIYCEPGSIVGSIGVLTGKLVFDDTLKHKLDVNVGEVKAGKNADLFSPLADMDEQQARKLDELAKDVADRFIHRVADGRRMSIEQVTPLATGEAWTGDEARALGLVDEIGGLQAAVRRAEQLAKLPEDTSRVEVFPRPNLWDVFANALGSQSSSVGQLGRLVSDGSVDGVGAASAFARVLDHVLSGSSLRTMLLAPQLERLDERDRRLD